MIKVAFALYDQLIRKSSEYREHVRDITMFNINVSMSQSKNKNTYIKFYEDTDITRLIQKASDDNMDYIMLVAMGFHTKDHSALHTIIKEAIENEHAIVGHLLEDNPQDPLNGFYHLHPQTIFIDLKQWAEIGKPNFGGFEKLTNTTLPLVERSPVNIHHDYTPTYLYPTNEIREYTGKVNEGWNLISQVLLHGKKVGNFSDNIRKYKSHMYPEMNDDRFEKILAGDTTIELPAEGPTYGQAAYIKETDFVLGNYLNSVFVFNNEPLNERMKYNKETKLDTLYAVAAGFKPQWLLTQTDYSGARVVYIDYSEPALNYRKWLVEQWDGNDYIGAINRYKSANPDFMPNWLFEKDYKPEWDKTIEQFGGVDAWQDVWNKYKTLEHRYIKTNLFGDYSEMVEDMKNHQGNNLVWISNSYYTPASIRNFQPKKLKEYFDNFKKDVYDNNISIQLLGSDNKGMNNWQHYGVIQ